MNEIIKRILNNTASQAEFNQLRQQLTEYAEFKASQLFYDKLDREKAVEAAVNVAIDELVQNPKVATADNPAGFMCIIVRNQLHKVKDKQDKIGLTNYFAISDVRHISQWKFYQDYTERLNDADEDYRILMGYEKPPKQNKPLNCEWSEIRGKIEREIMTAYSRGIRPTEIIKKLKYNKSSVYKAVRKYTFGD